MPTDAPDWSSGIQLVTTTAPPPTAPDAPDWTRSVQLIETATTTPMAKDSPDWTQRVTFKGTAPPASSSWVKVTVPIVATVWTNESGDYTFATGVVTRTADTGGYAITTVDPVVGGIVEAVAWSATVKLPATQDATFTWGGPYSGFATITGPYVSLFQLRRTISQLRYDVRPPAAFASPVTEMGLSAYRTVPRTTGETWITVGAAPFYFLLSATYERPSGVFAGYLVRTTTSPTTNKLRVYLSTGGAVKALTVWYRKAPL